MPQPAMEAPARGSPRVWVFLTNCCMLPFKGTLQGCTRFLFKKSHFLDLLIYKRKSTGTGKSCCPPGKREENGSPGRGTWKTQTFAIPHAFESEGSQPFVHVSPAQSDGTTRTLRRLLKGRQPRCLWSEYQVQVTREMNACQTLTSF